MPVKKTTRETLINQVYISYNEHWEDVLLNKIKEWYKQSLYFDEVYELIKTVIFSKHEKLVDLNFTLNNKILEYMGVHTPIRFTSEVQKNPSQDKNARIIDICKFFDADLLYDGKSAQGFIDQKLFQNAGITVIFQDYKHTLYKQLYGDFLPYMSIVDLLMNEGEKALSIILSSPRPDFMGSTHYAGESTF